MLPLELQSFVVRLAAVAPPAHLLLFLVPAEARAQLDINARRRGEPEPLRNLDKVQLVYIKNGAEGVRGVRLKVGTVAFLGRL